MQLEKSRLRCIDRLDSKRSLPKVCQKRFLSNVGYGRSQAATLWASSCSPSLSFTPWTTWARRSCPFSLRQLCSAVFVNLKTIASMPVRETRPRVLLVRSRTVLKVDSIGFVVRMWPTQIEVPALKGLNYENAETKLHASVKSTRTNRM